MQNIDSLLERFAYLDARASRGRGVAGRGDMQKHFQQAELFYLAQAICSHVSPGIQRELDAARREVMDQVVQGPKGLGSIIAPRKRAGVRWSDFQITPEFSRDIGSTGRFVSSAATRRLRNFHRFQVITVTNAVERWKQANSHVR